VLDSVAEPGAEQPVLPIYTGPTPANPFGGEAFDIFDVLEQAERALEQPFVPLARTAPLPMPASEPVVPAGPAAEPVAVVAAEPALEPALEATSESAHEPPPETALEPISAPVRQSVPAPVVEPVATEVEPPIDTAPEPVADPSVTDPSAAPMRVAPVPANDAKPEALIAPIVIGGDGDAPEVEKKRGWWRR
jgi:ribonuclease E